MTRERTLSELALVPALVGGQRGYVEASWKRTDGSAGSAIAYFRPKAAERWYISELLVHVPTTELLRDVPLARIEAAANADPKIREWIEDAAPPETVKRVRQAAAKRPRLARPSKRRLDDAFYEQVAAAYKGAVANGLHPAKTLAIDSETPPGTVNRWIAEARDRDYLPKGQRGKVTV
jgi:hypothetical protein